MAKRSKVKGNKFELKVAKDIVEAAGSLFGKKDCYRTPQSGGHKFAGESDLIVSPSLQAIFPFCVECKHHKDVRTSHFFHQTEKMRGFHEQVLGAAARDPFNRNPLLVIRGGDNESYASLPVEAARAWMNGLQFDGCDLVPVLHYESVGFRWIAMPWDQFLKFVTLYGGTLALELKNIVD
jgi:hypothetical protein